jgi:hypothetical protein
MNDHFGALQLAPDNQIYAAELYSKYIGRINDVNDYNIASYTSSAISIPANCVRGLPNTILKYESCNINVSPSTNSDSYKLSIQAHPASTQDITQWAVSIPSDADESTVIMIYSIDGKLIERVFLAGYAEGLYNISFSAKELNLTSGVYIGVLSHKGEKAQTKMLYMPN